MTEVGKISVAIEGDSSKLQDAAKKGAQAVSQMAGASAQAGQSLATVWAQLGQSGGAGMQVLAGGLLAAGVAFVAFKAAASLIAPVLDGIRTAFAASIQDAMQWEEAFANVRKVLGDTSNSAATKQLEDDLIALSTRIPVAATELAKFAQIGAQMGMQQHQLASFAETIARISTSFDGATAEKMALSLGKMQAQTKMTDDELRRFASAVMFVGAKTAATEAQIISVSEKWASMGHIVGLTNSQIVGFSAEAASLNNRFAESGTAMFRMLQTFQRAVDEGGKKAQAFAKSLDMPVEQFRKLAKENPAETFQRFMLSLGGTEAKANNVTKTLRDLGFTGRTTGGIFTAMANDSKGLADALKFASDEMGRGTAIVEMSNIRWDTATQRMKLLGNAITATSIEVGRTFLPALNETLSALEPLGHALFVLGDAFRVAFTRDLADTVKPAAGYVREIGVAVDAVATAVHKLAEEHGKAPIVKAFWDAAGSGIALVAEAAIMHIPVLREAMSIVQGLHDAGARLGQEGSGLTADARLIVPKVKTKAEQAEEEAATNAVLKMQERLREELDKLRDVNRSTYDSMMADIDRATEKRKLEAAAVAKDNIPALNGMLAVIKNIDQATKSAATSAFLDKVFGRGLTGAEKQMKDLADGLMILAKKGVEPTTNDLLHAMDVIRMFGTAGAESLARIESAAPGAIEQLERVYFATKKFYELKDIPLKNSHIFDAKNVPPLDGGIHFDKAGVDAFKDEIALFHDAQQQAQAYQNKLKDIQNEHKGWALALRTLDSLFKVLGISADSFLGRLLAGLTASNEAISQLTLGFARQFDKFNEKTGKFEGFKFNTEGALEMAAALIKIVAAFKQATDSANKWERAMNGALIGAQLGAKIGTFIQPGAGTIVGAVVGGIVGGVIGFFKTPSWAKAGEEAGTVLGVTISKQMAQAIEKTSKDLFVSTAIAALLHLNEVIQQSGRSVDQFQGQVGKLMLGVANGTIPATKGIEQISGAFDMASKEASQSGEMINRTMLAMIGNARVLGLEVQNISEHIKNNLNRAIAGVGTLFSPTTTAQKENKDAKGVKLAINTEADALAAAAIFNATFWGAVKEFGLIAAIDALEAPFDNLVAELGKKGFDVQAIFGDVFAYFELSSNEAFRGAAEAVVALREGLLGLANAGMLTAVAFHGFGHAAVQAYDQAFKASGSQQTAIMATLPLLAELQKAHDLYGYQLTEEEQTLMDIAAANGIAFPEDPILQVRDAIYELIEAITGIPRQVNIDINTHRTHSGDPPSPTGGGGGGDPWPGPWNYDGTPDHDGDPTTGNYMGSGGLVHARNGGVSVVLAEGGEDEWVVPQSKAAAFADQHSSNAEVVAELRAVRTLLSQLPLNLSRATRDAMLIALA